MCTQLQVNILKWLSYDIKHVKRALFTSFPDFTIVPLFTYFDASKCAKTIRGMFKNPPPVGRGLITVLNFMYQQLFSCLGPLLSGACKCSLTLRYRKFGALRAAVFRYPRKKNSRGEGLHQLVSTGEGYDAFVVSK